VLALLLIAGLGRLRLDTEVLSLLPASVPEVRGLQLYQRHFTDARELVLTVRAPDAEAAETAARLLAETMRSATQLVAAAVWQPPWQEHPEQMAEFLAYLWLNQPPARLVELSQRLAPDGLEAVARAACEQLATSFSPGELARLAYDPFGLSRLPETATGGAGFDSPQAGFASEDGALRAVFVEARTDWPNYRACVAWLAAVRAVVERVKASPGWPAGVVVSCTGAPAFVAQIATRMERDMRLSVLTALGCIAGLFWWAHRRWRPLGWLVVALAVVLTGALAAGGLVLGTLNAVSLGFGAILLGLAVDGGLVAYAEAAAHPGQAPAELRRRLAPVLAWSAVTTAVAFLLLNAAGLPGLSQLGTLVGLGILLAPVVMLFLFLPRARRGMASTSEAAPPLPASAPTSSHSGLARLATGLAAGLALLVLWRCGVPVEHGNRPLEPQGIPAQTALEELRAELGRGHEPLLVVIAGANEAEVADRLAAVETHLARARAKGAKFQAQLPTATWPHPEWQRVNRPVAAELAARGEALRAAATAAGFTSEAQAFTKNVLQAWARAANEAGALWPTNDAGRWLLRRAAARTATGWLAAGALVPETGPPGRLAAELDAQLPNVWLTGWPLLGERLAAYVERRIVGLAAVIVVFVALCLRLAFGRWREAFLSLAAVGFALLLLQAVLSLTGLAWNLMSLAAVPLLLGAGVDYTLHVQWALRRHGGDAQAMRRVTGRALLLCAGTSVAGFGSTAFSSHPGLASLGLVCAAGLALMCATALLLVPAWWPRLAGAPPAGDPLSRPSAAYGPRAWSLGLAVVRWLPRGACVALARTAAWAYRVFRPERVCILEANLRPVLAGDEAAARRAARRLLANFAVKVTDLLRHESGTTQGIAVSRWSGYEILQAALARGRGVLLVTPHLGNWEFGGCLLAQQGVRLLVLTQPEPGRGFTELRQQARARWGIETLVIGQDAFAFVEVIQRLQAGAVVALLVDRPPPNSAVAVELFGRPFQASIAPAELARASGCALVPVYVVAEGAAHAAHVLPEIAYDRRAIGDREGRRKLAGEILRAFEPVIRQHADQWYHFVPVWNEGPSKP
jgi:predicted exporter/lauroyl/myristoyl acyltransferase